MASAVIGSLRVVLGIDTGIFDKEMANLSKSLKGMGKTMQGVGQSMSAYLTAPILGFGALTVKTAGDFEAAMNRVGAATGSTGTEFEALETLARDLGRTTTKSASEAADMLEMLAKNGLNAGQILGGAAEAAIKLSEATGGDLSKSADVATNIMAQFGKEAKDLGPIVDQITGVTLQSQFGFEEYAQAIGQAGGVAGSLGVTLTDFNASIAATSDVFNSGSDAGTSFKTFLLRLVPASDGAAAAMEKLGLEFFDAAGKMKSMPAIAQELKDGLAGLSDEAKNDALNTIFGTDALRTAVALGNEGAAGIDAMVEAINKKGIADEQAAARMKGFNGELEKLSGAFDELKLAIADSGLLETITSLVTKIAEWVTALAATNPEILKWGTIVAGLVAIIGPVVLVVGTLVTAIAAIGVPIAAAVAGFAAVTAAVIAFWPEIKRAAEIFVLLNQAFLQAGAGLLDSLVAKFNEVTARIGQFAEAIVAIFMAVPAQMIAVGGQIIDGLWQGIQAKWESLKANVTGIASSIKDSFTGFFDIHSPSRVMHEVGTNIMQGLGNGMEGMKGTVVATATSTAGAVSNSFQEAGNSASSVFSGLGSSIAGLIDGTKEWSSVLSDVVGKLADIALQQLSAGFGGGSGGGGGFGGFFSGLLGGLLGFASGGTIMPGGTGGIDSQVVAFRKSPNERVDISKPGQTISNGGEAQRIWVGIDPNNGNVTQYVDTRIDQASPKIVGAAVQQSTQRVMPTVAHHQTAKAGGDYRNS
ncbi:phage tail tape measure protein [Rhizobium sp. PL01]|uniref:phage tail tape measure protein n=1 Tax=Rhizobium sp. PL01 TaxID=3085631 RepID=UPI002982383F|nr:phage tail tape measure protein [Rhizobium sp. PL01]MDW5315017.1 phage tail tape measure protein [Rhizobium sp. PL01]